MYRTMVECEHAQTKGQATPLPVHQILSCHGCYLDACHQRGLPQSITLTAAWVWRWGQGEATFQNSRAPLRSDVGLQHAFSSCASHQTVIKRLISDILPPEPMPDYRWTNFFLRVLRENQKKKKKTRSRVITAEKQGTFKRHPR